MNTKIIKVYETSIIPPGSQIEPVREAKHIASSSTLEVFHIMCFLGVFAFIFAGIWRRAVAIEKNIYKDKTLNTQLMPDSL